MSKDLICPLIRKACIESRCRFWTRVSGANPQTGVLIDQYDCAVAWLPILLVENSRRATGTTAAVESLRNEVTQRQDQLNNAVALGQREAAKRIGGEEWSQERLPKAT